MRQHRAIENLDVLQAHLLARADQRNFRVRRAINRWRTLAEYDSSTNSRRKLTENEWRARNAALGIKMVGFEEQNDNNDN